MSAFRRASCAIPHVHVISVAITRNFRKKDEMQGESYLKETLTPLVISYKWLEASSHHNWHTREDATAKRRTVSRNTANVFTQESSAPTYANVKTA